MINQFRKLIYLEAMNVLSTLGGLNRANYRLLKELDINRGSKSQLESVLWDKFLKETKYGQVVADIETAFSKYVTNITVKTPGMDSVTVVKLRPDMSDSRFISKPVQGMYA